MKKAYRRALMLLLAFVAGLTSCTLGEAVLPDPAPLGEPAAQDIGSVVLVPAPIPHPLEGREECFTCHAIGAVDAPAVPANHEQDVGQCTTCHAVWTKPGIASLAPPAIGHEVEGRADCLTCHKIGTAGAPRVPEHHTGLSSSICRSCHLVGDEVPGGSVEAIGQAPPIPHGLEGFATCTVCHEQGGGGVPQFPADHVGRADDICTACHSAAAPEPTSAPVAPPTQVPTATPAETPTASDAQAAGPPPAIPHTLAGHDACTLCHEDGGAGVPQFPADHAGRPDGSCTACHSVAAPEPTSTPVVPPTQVPTATPAETPTASDAQVAGPPPAIPHSLAGHDACTLCHEDGGPGVPQFPADHAGRPDSSCTACHSATAEEASESPALAGADLFAANCAACHGDEGQGGAVASDAINTAEALAEDEELQSVISNGEGSMPGFAGRLSGEEIGILIEFMRSWLP